MLGPPHGTGISILLSDASVYDRDYVDQGQDTRSRKTCPKLSSSVMSGFAFNDALAQLDDLHVIRGQIRRYVEETIVCNGDAREQAMKSLELRSAALASSHRHCRARRATSWEAVCDG